MSNVPLANWNGTETPLDQVRVSVLDRSFLFGDAVYEALRCYDGRAWLLREHMDRLDRSLRELRIACDVARVERRLLETLAHSGARDALVYLQITRGEAPRTHFFPRQPTTPNELIWVSDLGGDPHAGRRATGVRCVTFADLRWERRDIKSVNLLRNVLASQAAVERDCYEAILIEPSGLISEASHNSVFAVKSGALLTAPISHHILPGITRGLVLKLAKRAGIPITEQHFRHADLAGVDELFLTGTTTEVLGVVAVDDQPVGTGAVGPVTQLLQRTYQAAVQDWLAGEAD